MSSYLLFFGLGDFERITRKVNGVDVGVVVTRGDTERGKFALNAASQILPYYENYFGVKYPLPKLDLIAGPGESQFFGAMENWGAIFFFDRDLLIDPKTSTESDKRGVYITVAHEMAHQWFGDLVTMQWWDDIWLNEGFASWMELKVTDNFHPEWKAWLQAMAGKEYAMSIDARKGTHPIIQPIHDVMQANEAFDAITYLKGQSVIRMLEDYLGAEKFRAGVRAYIKAHEYGNAVTDNLWTALDKVQTVPVATIAHGFTLQAGVPLIRVAQDKSGITLTQDRFAADKSGKAKRTWDVPVIVKVLGSKYEWRGLVSAGHPAHLSLAAGAVPVVNAGQGGYYRTLYAGPLAHSVAEHFTALSPADQLGTLADASALGFAGYEPLANFLDLTEKAAPGMDPLVLRSVAGSLAGLDQYYRGLPGRATFRAYATGLLDPVFAQVGWTAKAGEGPNVPLLRSTLLSALSLLGDKTVIAEADARFAAYLKDPASLSPEMRRNVLNIVSTNASPKIWEELHKLAKTAPTALLRSQLYADLGRAADPALARKALELALTDEAPVTVRPSIIRTVAGSDHPDMAFNFTMAHLAEINSWLEPDSRNEFAARTAAGTFDPATLEKLKAYVEAHVPPTAQGTAITVEAAIAYAIGVRHDRLPAVDHWLAARKK